MVSDHGEQREEAPQAPLITPELKAEILEPCQHGDRSKGQVARGFDLADTAVVNRPGKPSWMPTLKTAPLRSGELYRGQRGRSVPGELSAPVIRNHCHERYMR